MRLIDADELIESLMTAYKNYRIWDSGKVLTVIITEPTIDAVEVVRCKDCDWWEKSKESIHGRCALFGFYPTGTYYCASGERTEK